MADETVNTTDTEDKKTALESITDFLSSDAGVLTAAGLGAIFGGDMTKAPAVGYQGSIPEYTGVRQQIGDYDTTRRPGSGGRRYFTDLQYVPQTGEGDAEALTAAQTAADTQATGLATLNKNNPAFELAPILDYTTPSSEIVAATASPASSVATTTQQLPDYYGLNALTQYLESSPYSNPYDYIKNNPFLAKGGSIKSFKFGGINDSVKNKKLDPLDTEEATEYAGWDQDLALALQNNPELFFDAIGYIGEALGLGALAIPTYKYGKKFLNRNKNKYDVGGIIDLISNNPNKFAKGKYLDGSTDGMADKVPANIEGIQEARLSDGEFVIPADVVSHLGNGNSDAGAKVLEDMMARVRKARTGSTKQGKEINPRDFLPA